MWFKNINTGLEWLILDKKKIEELKSNPNFVEVEKPLPNKEKGKEESEKKKTSNKRNNPNQTKTIECEICGRKCHGQRSYTQHKRMAHGIDKNGNKVDTRRYNAKFNNKKKDGDE